MDGPRYPKCKKVYPCSASRKFIPPRMILTEYLDKMRNNLNVYDQKNALAVKVKSSLTLKNVDNKEEKSFIWPKQ